MSISSVLKQRRKELNMTLAEVAKRVGVSEATVQRWESGNIKNLRHDRIGRLAEVLNVSPAVLMGWQEAPPSIPHSPEPLSSTNKAPIVGSIPAGYPVFAQEDIEGYADIPYSDEENYFFLRVKGDSMEPVIHAGDLVLIRRQNWAEENQIVAARVNGDEATLKRYKRQGNMILLLPENQDYDPYVVPIEDFDIGEASIIGVALETRHKL